MKKGMVLFAFVVLSSVMAGDALAGPFRAQRIGHPHQQRPAQPEGTQGGEENRESKNSPYAQQAITRGGDAARNGEASRFGEGGRNGEVGQGGASPAPQMPGGRAGARMSLEERQRLRRQINEAGRSLYTPPAPTGNK